MTCPLCFSYLFWGTVKRGIKARDLLPIRVYFFRLTESILRDRSIRRKNRLPSRRRKNRFHPMRIVVSCAMSLAQGQMPMLHTWKDQNIKRYTEMQVAMVVFHPLIMEQCPPSPPISFGNHVTTRGEWKDNMSNYSCLVITCMFSTGKRTYLQPGTLFLFPVFPLFFFRLRKVNCFGETHFQWLQCMSLNELRMATLWTTILNKCDFYISDQMQWKSRVIFTLFPSDHETKLKKKREQKVNSNTVFKQASNHY